MDAMAQLRAFIFQSTLPVWGATGLTVATAGAIIFQSTLPVWGATTQLRIKRGITQISIHAPRVGSDINSSQVNMQFKHFNPRSPCGERRDRWPLLPSVRNFNPRSPCGERLCRKCLRPLPGHFNPRSPCGERQQTCTNTFLQQLHYTPKLQKKATDFCL